MRTLEAGQAAWHRIRRPSTWGAVLLFGLGWALVRWLLGLPARSPEDLLGPFLWAFLFLAITPVPWQWTGDGAPLARPWRGLLQALPWNAGWVLVLLLAFGSGPRPFAGPGHGPGPGRGSRGLPLEDRGGPPLRPRLVLLALTSVSVCVLLGWILADKERAEAMEEQAHQAAALAQARVLQGQMNPHVLFNALSGLTELVREDPLAAEQALVNLSTLLRGLLEQGARATIPLAQERELVTSYLALEQVRLGRRLAVAWHWDPGLDALELPPLLLQPLVENAIKHGIAPSRAGGALHIRARACGDRLELEVANTGHPLVEGAPDGVGLGNLKARLALLGRSPGSFHLRQEAEWTLATLTLPRPGVPA